jgi:hypothetical protein
MPFQKCFELNNGDDFRKPLAEGLALFGQRDAFGVGQPPMRRVPIQQGAVDTVFLEDKLEFLEEKGFDLASGPGKHLLPRHGQRWTPVTTWTSQSGLLGNPTSTFEPDAFFDRTAPPPSFRNGPMINVPPVAAEAEVREEDVNRVGPAADIHRLKAFCI